ncbi:MAG TPA: hypothetical protein VFT53_02520, partial [Candidatus Saccharimonadales bacterium]|nr:hypothetical protein [Candidatus Saccharimonadales bacterium]
MIPFQKPAQPPTTDSNPVWRHQLAALKLFDTFIVICNPISTDAHKAARRIQELKRLFPDAEHIVINTARGGRGANGRLLSKYADKF